MIRTAVRLALVALAVLIGYLAFTFVQVLLASRSDDTAKSDAVVVLGAAQYDGRPSPVLRGRLDHALQLYRDGVAPRIVVTGSKQPGDRFTEAFAGFQYLRDQGVPESAITVVDDGSSSWESLAAANRVLDQQGVSTVTLVSDGYHNLRLGGISGEIGMDAVESPSSEGGSVPELIRETGLVALGRIIGYGRMLRYSP